MSAFYRSPRQRAVRFYSKWQTWERIARRRAEIIASQGRQLDGFARALTQSNDEKQRLLDTLTEVCRERDIAQEKADNPLMVVSPSSDDSGREYPQAWQPAGLRDEVIYRQGEGWPEFWGPSIPGAGLGWCRCGDAFRTMDDINAHWAKRARVTLVKVPSPDCKNCEGTGTVQFYAGESYDCPVCCGGR